MIDEEAVARETAARFEMVKARYGGRLTPEQLEEVRQGVEQVVRAALALESVALSNGDEPFSVFAPYRKEALA